MKKLLLLICALLGLGTSGAWATDWTPSISDHALIVTGEKVSSVTAATDGNDNSHWYFVTQVRGGESAIYDNGTQIMRGSTSATPASFNLKSASANAAYLVRFISTGSAGIFNVQFGNGRYAKNYDSTPGNEAVWTATTAGSYAFYNCNDGTGSYFGWNFGTDTGKSVNNNGAGNSVAFWYDGKRSGTSTSDNAIWYVYAVSFEEGVNVTYNLYESDGTTFVQSEDVLQRKSSAVSIPSSFKSGYKATDYTYETTGTIGTSDCSIKVVRTLKANGNTPSIPDGAYMTVSTAASSMTAATSADDNDHWYIITQNRGGSETPLYDVNTYSTIYRAGSSVTPSSFNNTAVSGKEQYLVRFIGTGEAGLYYMQFANGNYVAPASESRYNGVTLVSAQTVNSAGTFAFYVCPAESSTFGWKVDGNGDSDMTVDNNSAGGSVLLWGDKTPSGSKLWTIYPVELSVPSYFVQYSISFGGKNVFTSEEIPANNGDVITELPSVCQRAFCNYSVTSTTVTTPGVTTVPVTMTWDGPFTISADYASATWDLLQMRQGGYNVKYVADAAYYPLEAKGLMTTEDDAYLWAFIGDPYDGFEIVNKAAGSTKKLYAGASPANGGYPLMSSENTTKWLVNGSPKDSEAGGFGLQVPGKTMYINDYSGNRKFSFWQQSTSVDAGSTLTVAKQYPLLVSNNISPYFNSVGQLFSLKSNAATVSKGSTWSAAVSSCNKTTYDDLLSFVSDADNIRYPEDGHFYYIKNAATNKYLCIGNANGSLGGGCYDVLTTATKTPACVVKVSISDSKPYFYGQGLQYSWASASPNATTGNARAEATGKYVHYNITKAGQGNIALVLGNGENLGGQGDFRSYTTNSYYKDNGSGVVIGGTAADANAQWIFEEATSVDIPLTAANDNTSAAHTYATLCVPFNITNLVGANSKEVKAYAPTKSGDYIVPGSGATTVTEGTPVLLIGAEGATSVTATIGSNYATTPATTNVLTGTFTGASINCASGSNNYVLGFDSENDNRIGFYHVSGGSSFALKANRAYLNTSAGVKGFAISFGDIIDSIKAMDNTPVVHDGPIFNLAGQRMNKLQRGVNIVKGKKFIVK